MGCGTVQVSDPTSYLKGIPVPCGGPFIGPRSSAIVHWKRLFVGDGHARKQILMTRPGRHLEGGLIIEGQRKGGGAGFL